MRHRVGPLHLYSNKSIYHLKIILWSYVSTLLLQAKGGALAFIQTNQSSTEEIGRDGTLPQALLAYVNGDHEYVLFDPYNKEVQELSISHKEIHPTPEETGGP